MKQKIAIILILVMAIDGPPGVISQSDICINASEARICYDARLSFEKGDVLSWSIVEATFNNTRVHHQNSFIDSWKLEARFLQDFASVFLNDPNNTIDVYKKAYTSIYEFNFVNESRYRAEVNLKEGPAPPIPRWDTYLWFSHANYILQDGLFSKIEKNNYSILYYNPKIPYIMPTIFVNGSTLENRFERDIRDITISSMNHTIINNVYHIFQNRSVVNINYTLDLSININSGILQKLRYEALFNSGENLVICIELGSPLSANLSLGNFDTFQILFIVTPILILMIFIILRRLNRS